MALSPQYTDNNLLRARQILRFTQQSDHPATASFLLNDIRRAGILAAKAPGEPNEENWPQNWETKPKSLPAFITSFRKLHVIIPPDRWEEGALPTNAPSLPTNAPSLSNSEGTPALADSPRSTFAPALSPLSTSVPPAPKRETQHQDVLRERIDLARLRLFPSEDRTDSTELPRSPSSSVPSSPFKPLESLVRSPPHITAESVTCAFANRPRLMLAPAFDPLLTSVPPVPERGTQHHDVLRERIDLARLRFPSSEDHADPAEPPRSPEGSLPSSPFEPLPALTSFSSHIPAEHITSDHSLHSTLSPPPRSSTMAAMSGANPATGREADNAFQGLDAPFRGQDARAPPVNAARAPAPQPWRPLYTDADFRRDAGIVYAVEEGISLGMYAELYALMNDALSAKVRHVLAADSERVQHERLLVAQQQLQGPVNPAATVDRFRRVIERFMTGPLDNSPPRVVPGSSRQPRTASPTAHRGERSRSRHSSSQDAVRSARNNRFSAQRSPVRHLGGARSTPSRISVNPSAYKLKPDMFEFDGKNVDAYIAKIQHLANICGEEAVVANLSVGILGRERSEGARWFMSLSDRERQSLGLHLGEWPGMLRARFRKDRGAIMMEADALAHSFDKEDKLPLWTYVDDKVHLYNEAGDVDEDAQVRRIHQKLDPMLRVAITLRETDNTLPHFRNLVQRCQFNVRQQWEEERNQRNSMQKMLSDLNDRVSHLSRTNGNGNSNRYDNQFSNRSRGNSINQPNATVDRDQAGQARGRPGSRDGDYQRGQNADKTQGSYSGGNSNSGNQGSGSRNASANNWSYRGSDSWNRNDGRESGSARVGNPSTAAQQKSAGQNRSAYTPNNRQSAQAYPTDVSFKLDPQVVDSIVDTHRLTYQDENEGYPDPGDPSSKN